MMKTNLVISTLLLTMAFSIPACGKETDPVVTESMGTPVMEETVSLTPTETETIEKAAPVKVTEVATEEATVVDVAATMDGTEDIPYTAEEIATFTDEDVQYVKNLYAFLCRMDPTMVKTDDIVEIYNLDVWDIADADYLLNLLNQDFAKAYDIIEKCGVDVTTDDGRVLKAAEMRTTITDFDSFDAAYGDIINYEIEIARIRNEYADKAKAALNAKDATNGKVYLDKWDAMDFFIEPLDEFVEFYKMAYGL